MAMQLKSKDAGVIRKFDVRCIIDCFKHSFWYCIDNNFNVSCNGLHSS